MNSFHPIIRRCRYTAYGAALLLTACAMPMSNRIGVLGTAGPNVFLNSQHAQNGALVSEGDEVTTGANSSAIIDFTDGGFFQLDQNTDPLFLKQRLQAGYCILVRMMSGQAYLDKPAFCLETPTLTAINNSQVNIIATRQQSILTLLKGNVRITRPDTLSVRPGQQVTSTARGGISTRVLSKRALQDTTRWRSNYSFMGWCCVRNQIRKSPRQQCPAQDFSFNQQRLSTRCQQFEDLPMIFTPRAPRRAEPTTRDPG